MQAGAARPVIIGAGWSGLACAVALAERGMRPIVLDASPQAGGRARSVDHDLGGHRLRLDNGQHLLLGAYRETLQVMQRVGVAPSQAFERRPFALGYPDGWRLAAARREAPWHLALGLLGARRVPLTERWALAQWVSAQRAAQWQLAGDGPAAAALAGLPRAIVRRLFRPLCLAALNVEPEHASARMFFTVLRDTLGADAQSSDVLLPRTDLSALFPAAASAWLQARGADVRLHCPVLGVRQGAGDSFELVLRDERLAATHVVLAVAPDRAAALLSGVAPALDSVVARLRDVRFAPICTTYLRYAQPPRLGAPYLALLDDPAHERFGQWVFDRGLLDASLAGVLAVVVSGTGPHLERSGSALGLCIANQVASALKLPMPAAHFTLMEKHATIVPVPGLQRPAVRLPVEGMYLASDSAQSPYPSTIEGSVRAGLEAAATLADATAR